MGVLRLVERLLLRGLVRLAVAGPLGEERGQQVDGLDAARGEIGEQLPLEGVCDLADETRERRAVARPAPWPRAPGKISALVGTGTNSKSTPCFASRSLNADDRRDRVLVPALLAQIAAQRVGERRARRTGTRRRPPAPSRRPGRSRAGALSARVQGRDLLRPARPTSRRARPAPRARHPRRRRGVGRGDAARKRGRRRFRRRRRRRAPARRRQSGRRAKTL